MKILYLDCYSGISGDMFLGALVDTGLDVTLLKRELLKLGLKGYAIKTKRATRGGLSCTKLDVELRGKDSCKRRTLKDILAIINRSRLDKDVKDRATQIFRSLAMAESSVHKENVRHLHFHEVGDTDSIVDVVGAAAALKILRVGKVYASAVNIGGGTIIRSRGGVLPIPAPAALYLLKGIPVVSSDIRAELVTPTGAALLKAFVDRFQYFPAMTLKGIGYGAGSNEIEKIPNCLRVMIGEAAKDYTDADKIFVIEANIDNMNPVDYERLMERLFREGALDAYLTSVQMKKTRPGILLTVLAKAEDLDRLKKVIFDESTTIGVRYYEAQRRKLKREIARVNTRYGKVRIKISHLPGGEKKIMPEYDDCKRIADSRNIPLSRVRREVETSLRGGAERRERSEAKPPRRGRSNL